MVTDLSTQMSRALGLTMKTLSKNGSRKVHNAIYEAEKSLFQKMGKTLEGQHLSEVMEVVLVEYVQTLRKSMDQVEQTRIKAAEAAITLASLSGSSERVQRALIDWITSTKTDERSVQVQQSLDIVRRAMTDV